MMKALGGMGAMNKMRMMKGLMSGGLANLGAASSMLHMKKGTFMEKKDRNKKKKRR